MQGFVSRKLDQLLECPSCKKMVEFKLKFNSWSENLSIVCPSCGHETELKYQMTKQEKEEKLAFLREHEFDPLYNEHY